LSRVASEVVLVDFGMGNLRSVSRALEHAGATSRCVSDPDDVRRAERLIVPGVGALGDCMRTLRSVGLDEAICEYLESGRPYLGICLGLHLLFEWGEEGEVRGLGVIPGRIERFPAWPDRCVPHMGWNRVSLVHPHPVIGEGYYYFAHSYRPVGAPREVVLGSTEYGECFPSAVSTGNAVAVQFHPEKSQRTGLALLVRFLEWSP
jgi:glutamine amidotransferase